MAELTPQLISFDGAIPTYAPASAGGDKFLNDGKTLLHFKNGGGVSINITLASPGECSQGHTHNKVYALGAGAELMICNLEPTRFNDQDRKVNLTYSSVAGLTVAVIKFI